MKFPEFDPELRNPYLFNGLVEDIAEREGIDSRYDCDPKSQALGALCLSLVDGTTVDTSLRYRLNQDDHGGRNSILSTVHDMAIYAFNPDKATAFQKEMHHQVIRSLRGKLDRSFTSYWGIIVEEVGLGLLTRYAHPNMIAYPSLPHHEQDKDLAGHYDLGVVIKNPDNSIDSHHLQVKSGCFGLCEHEHYAGYFENDLMRYRPYIQLLSGCCHLKSKKGPDRKVVAELLVMEADENITPAEVKLLDTITDQLVFQMTTEQLPRGKAKGGSIDFSTESFMRFV